MNIITDINEFSHFKKLKEENYKGKIKSHKQNEQNATNKVFKY